MSYKYLINEMSIQLYPSLANAIGVDEALALQQLHFVLQNPKLGKVVDGKKWFRNSLTGWHEQNFKFWSESKISRLYRNLEDKELVFSRNDLNKIGYDRTKWYTINYEQLDSVIDTLFNSQKCKLQDSNLQDGSFTSDRTIPNNTSNNTSNNSSVSYETDGNDSFQQSEPQIDSDIERKVYEQMSAIGTINLMDMLSENEEDVVSNVNIIADKDHPAIIAWRKVTKRYPKKELFQIVADKLGNNPNEEILRFVRTKWIAKGYNPMNIDDQLDWYTQALEWHRMGGILKDWKPAWRGKGGKQQTDELRGLSFE